jgi:hypothetical protein
MKVVGIGLIIFRVVALIYGRGLPTDFLYIIDFKGYYVGWICGICGVTAEQRKATSVFRWLEDQVILRGHVMDEHQVMREGMRDT